MLFFLFRSLKVLCKLKSVNIRGGTALVRPGPSECIAEFLSMFVCPAPPSLCFNLTPSPVRAFPQGSLP